MLSCHVRVREKILIELLYTAEDWNATAASLQEIMPTIPDMLLTNTITIYVCAAKDAQQEVNMLYTVRDATF